MKTNRLFSSSLSNDERNSSPDRFHSFNAISSVSATRRSQCPVYSSIGGRNSRCPRSDQIVFHSCHHCNDSFLSFNLKSIERILFSRIHRSERTIVRLQILLNWLNNRVHKAKAWAPSNRFSTVAIRIWPVKSFFLSRKS